MSSLYARWMYDWETRLTSVDSNRVVRPLEWGIEWTRDWPCRNGFSPARTDAECERYLCEYNRRAIASSDEFFSYRTPSDFRLENREVQVFSTREVPDPLLEKKVRGTRTEFCASLHRYTRLIRKIIWRTRAGSRLKERARSCCFRTGIRTRCITTRWLVSLTGWEFPCCG